MKKGVVGTGRRGRNIFLIAFVFLMFSVSGVSAANIHVGQSSTGSGSGADWNNQVAWSSVNFVRGNTYYIADGSYSGKTFNTAESGTTYITIKKATVADNGIAMGWSDTFGDGQAVFGSLEFTSSYWVFDGQTRNESDWFDKTAYGFSVVGTGDWPTVLIANNAIQTNNVTLRYAYILAIVGNLPDTGVRRMCISTENGGGEIRNGIGHVFQRLLCDGGTQHWFVRNSEAPLIEYSASDRITGNLANRGENVNLYYNGDNSIIRYNKFRNSFIGQGTTPEGGGTAVIAIAYTGGHQIYGNLFYNYQTGGIYGSGQLFGNIKIYDNTFVNSRANTCGIKLGDGTGNEGTGNFVYNNIWMNTCWPDIAGATHNYNAFSGSNSLGEADEQLNVPISIFSNYVTDDFTLKTNTNPGTPLSAPHNVDMFGNIRGADDVWDRGAYEYISGSQITQYHPADTERDLTINANEFTAYNRNFKLQLPDHTSAPSVDYYSRANYLFMMGERYHFDSANAACNVAVPAATCWLSG